MIFMLLALALPAGKPVIVVPMYSRCPSVCLTITRNLKKATAQASADPSSYRVVMVSIDPRDTAADMEAFRQREKVPESWRMMTGAPADVHKLMDDIGFRYLQSNGGFSHPSIAAVFTPGLRLATVMPGNNLQIDRAIAIARGGRDWMREFGGVALAGLLFVSTMSVIALLSMLRQGRTERLRGDTGSTVAETSERIAGSNA